MTRKKSDYFLTPESLRKIKTARDRQGLTHEILAEKSGTSRATYTRLENGRTNVLNHTFQNVCSELNLDVQVYVSPKDEKIPDIETALKELRLLRNENESLKEKIRYLEIANRAMAGQLELLDENRNLRMKTENRDSDKG